MWEDSKVLTVKTFHTEIYQLPGSPVILLILLQKPCFTTYMLIARNTSLLQNDIIISQMQYISLFSFFS